MDSFEVPCDGMNWAATDLEVSLYFANTATHESPALPAPEPPAYTANNSPVSSSTTMPRGSLRGWPSVPVRIPGIGVVDDSSQASSVFVGSSPLSPWRERYITPASVTAGGVGDGVLAFGVGDGVLAFPGDGAGVAGAGGGLIGDGVVPFAFGAAVDGAFSLLCVAATIAATTPATAQTPSATANIVLRGTPGDASSRV